MQARQDARLIDAEEAVREAKFARASRKRNLATRAGATLQFTELGFGAGDFDMFLLAGRYTLLEQEALQSFLPYCLDRKIGVVIGGPFNSGILATGPKRGARYDYKPASPAAPERVRRIETICKAHGVKLAEAALRFPLNHPAIVSVIPGGQKPGEVRRNAAMLGAQIPAAMWRALKAEGLLRADAPTPRQRSKPC